MADEQTTILDNANDTFGAGVWGDVPLPPPPSSQINPEPPAPPPPPTEPPPTAEPPADVFDANDYIKAKFGFENEEQAIEQLRILREKAETPAQHKFANEQSEQFYNYVVEGKEDELYDFFSKKKQLERADKLDLTKVSDAAEIIRVNLKFKYEDLSEDEIVDIFQETYVKPAKPVKGFDQEDVDYQAQLDQWKLQCEAVDKRIIREAKMAKPELSKFKTELILPKIEKAPPTPAQPTQEELAKADQEKQVYFQQVDKGLGTLKGFSSTYKDKDVEIPVSYDITPEDKAKVKPIVESLYSDFSYFVNRWQNKDGSWNTALMGEDLYLLENKGTVHQKFVNDAAGKMKEHYIKLKKNINVDGPSNQPKFEPKDSQQKFEEGVWS